MLKKLRWRFIGAAMAAFSAVVLALVCVVNVWNWQNVTQQQDETLLMLLEADLRLPTAQGTPPFSGMDRFSPEVPYMLRYFSVYYDAYGAVRRVNQEYIASVSRSDALNYADDVISSGHTEGYYSGYRYLVERNALGTAVVFLNSEKELRAAQSLLFSSLAIALGCLAVVFLLVMVLSRRAIAPYLRNLETQKQFITNASHELKTPLTAIAASADVLAMEQPEDEWVRSIQTQAARLSKLITNLVTLSRLNEENPFPARAPFSLSDALWETAEPFASLARAKGRVYTQDIADGLTVTGDRAAIQQMVSILLDNAVKYSPEGGQIMLCAQRAGKRAEISVRSTCDGAETIDVDRLFERFYRADESHSGKVGGTGIGLSIARATAEAHGGSIRAAREGGDLVFLVRL